jgi:undecaprenyl-diphosphatase
VKHSFKTLGVRFFAPALVFVALALVRRETFVLSLDRRLYAVAMDLSYPERWIAFWEAISGFGNGWFVFPLLAVSAAAFLFKRHRARDFAAVLCVAVGGITNTVLKFLFRLERPVSLSPYTDLATYTFPSGHAFNSVLLFYFMPGLWDAAFPGNPGKSGMPAAFAAFCIGMVGLSRVMLGAHWGSDVFGGWLLGFSVSNALLAAIRRKDPVHEEKI